MELPTKIAALLVLTMPAGAAAQPAPGSVPPGTVIREQVGATFGDRPLWSTGRFLRLRGDTVLYVSKTSGDTLSTPVDRVLVGRRSNASPRAHLIGTGIGAAIGAGIAAASFEPLYGRDLDQAITCSIRNALGGECDPPKQVNSRPEEVAFGALRGLAVGWLFVHYVLKKTRWEPIQVMDVSLGPGAEAPVVSVRVPVR